MRLERRTTIILVESAIIVSAALCLGCAAHSTAARARRSAAASGSANSVVTAAELSLYAPHSSLMEALERLRPFFLYARGTSPQVSIDGSPPSDLSVLSSIAVSQVAEVRLLRASSSVGHSSALSNGDVVVGGSLLLVLTRKQ